MPGAVAQKGLAYEQGLARTEDHGIGGQGQLDDIERFRPRDAESLALSEGVGGEALVLAEELAIAMDDRSWAKGLGRGAAEKARDPLVTDEADVLALALVGGGQSAFGGQGPDRLLGHRAERETRMGELFLAQRKQEIGLILEPVGGATEQVALFLADDARIMPGRHALGANRGSVAPEVTEFDGLVTADAGVRGLTSAVTGNEIGDHTAPELLFEIDHIMWHARLQGHRPGVDGLTRRTAGIGTGVATVLFGAGPQLHCHADHLVSGLAHQNRSQARIHAATHAHHDPTHGGRSMGRWRLRKEEPCAGKGQPPQGELLILREGFLDGRLSRYHACLASLQRCAAIHHQHPACTRLRAEEFTMPIPPMTAVILALACTLLGTCPAAEAIRIGQSAALEGPAQGLGLGIKQGLEAALAETNAAGGVHGRPLELVALNDGYEPDLCVEATLRLIEEEEVFCLAGYVGTPTAKVAVPIIADLEVPLVGLFTGAGFLRDPEQPWFPEVFNLRASYDQETEAIVEHLTSDLGIERIAVFFQDDSFGRVGLSGTTKALTKRGMEIVSQGTYPRNTTAVKSGLSEVQAGNPQAVVMVGAYQPLAEFVATAKASGLDAVFCTISFVGTENLIAALGAEAEGLVISQVVPSPTLSELPIAQSYRAALRTWDATAVPTYVSFEGYLNGALLAAALEAAGPDPDREALRAAFNAMNAADLGGLALSFGPSDHQGLDAVHMTQVSSGVAQPVEQLSKP